MFMSITAVEVSFEFEIKSKPAILSTPIEMTKTTHVAKMFFYIN